MIEHTNKDCESMMMPHEEKFSKDFICYSWFEKFYASTAMQFFLSNFSKQQNGKMIAWVWSSNQVRHYFCDQTSRFQNMATSQIHEFTRSI